MNRAPFWMIGLIVFVLGYLGFEICDDRETNREEEALAFQDQSLTRKTRQAHSRVEARRRVITLLDQQEMSLAQAAAWFWNINRGSPESMGNLMHCFSGSDAEKCYRQVITWYEMEFGDRYSAEKFRWIMQQFESEMQSQRKIHGRLVLPGVDPTVEIATDMVPPI